MSLVQLAVAQVMTPSWWNEPGEQRPRERQEKRELSRNRQQFNTDRRMKTAMRYKKVMADKSVTVTALARTLHMNTEAARNAINRLCEDGFVVADGFVGRAQLWKWVNK